MTYLLSVFAWLCSYSFSVFLAQLTLLWHTQSSHRLNLSSFKHTNTSPSRFLCNLIHWRREVYCTSCKVVVSVAKWLTCAGLLNVFWGLFTGWKHDALGGIPLPKRNTVLHIFPPQTDVGIHKEGKIGVSKYQSDSDGKRKIAINTWKH